MLVALVLACTLALPLGLVGTVALLGGGASLPAAPAVSWASWSRLLALPACEADPSPAAAALLLGLLPRPGRGTGWARQASTACRLGSGLAAVGPDRWRLSVLAMALSASPGLSQRRVDFLVAVAGAIGTPYRWGGADASGYDCSGLVFAMAHEVGLNPPRVAQEQFSVGLAVAGPSGQPGDLVFFGSSPKDIGHVGVVVDEAHMVDAPHTGALVRLEDDRWPELQGVRALPGMDG